MTTLVHHSARKPGLLSRTRRLVDRLIGDDLGQERWKAAIAGNSNRAWRMCVADNLPVTQHTWEAAFEQAPQSMGWLLKAGVHPHRPLRCPTWLKQRLPRPKGIDIRRDGEGVEREASILAWLSLAGTTEEIAAWQQLSGRFSERPQEPTGKRYFLPEDIREQKDSMPWTGRMALSWLAEKDPEGHRCFAADLLVENGVDPGYLVERGPTDAFTIPWLEWLVKQGTNLFHGSQVSGQVSEAALVVQQVGAICTISSLMKNGHCGEEAVEARMTALQWLIERGANVNEREPSYGSTALMKLLDSRNIFVAEVTIRLIETLMERGADWDVRDNRGRRAIDRLGQPFICSDAHDDVFIWLAGRKELMHMWDEPMAKNTGMSYRQRIHEGFGSTSAGGRFEAALRSLFLNQLPDTTTRMSRRRM